MLNKQKRRLVTGLIVGISALSVALMSACSATPSSETAADWPTSKLEIVVPSDPGSTPDLLVRAMSEQLKNKYNVRATVLNKPGSGGTLGMRDVVDAKTDGTKIGISFSSALLWQPRVNDDTAYGADGTGYETLVQVAESPSSLIVAGDAPWNTLQEFAADAESRELKIAITGKNTQSDLISQLLSHNYGWKLNTVAFTDGGAEGLLAVMRGEVDAQISTTGVAQSQIDAGELRVLSVFSDSPEPNNPDATPSSDEGIDPPLPITFYLVAPEGIDEALLQAMRDELGAIVMSEEWKDALLRMGFAHSVATFEDAEADLDRQRLDYDALATVLLD